MTDPAQAIATAEAALRDAAREHKRLERAHRQEARRLMQTAADLRAMCARLGLRLEIVGRDGGQSRND